MATSVTADFRTRLQDWLPKVVLAPSFAVILLFVYGFIAFTVVLSFTGSKMLPKWDFIGFENYAKLFALQHWSTAVTNLAIFARNRSGVYDGTARAVGVHRIERHHPSR